MTALIIALLLLSFDSIDKRMTTAPVAIVKPEPQYTPEERAAGIEGEVWISTLIDENGIPTELKIMRSLHPKLDAQALAAVAQWRFKPGTRDTEPVAVRATLAVSFRLRNPQQ
jgi:TonB family protein